jgi:hypothetical protein
MQNKFVQVETLFQEGNIQQVRIGIKAKLPTPELAQLLMSLLEQLVNDCRFVLYKDYRKQDLPEILVIVA